MINWECFCDECYYGLWAVRQVGENRWGHCFHVQTKEEADGLRDLLNELQEKANKWRNFDTLKRLVRGRLCRHGRHRWSYFTKQTKALVFYERSCQWCGLFEINSAGPTGDKKWHKPESCFNGPCGDWEREQYNTATSTFPPRAPRCGLLALHTDRRRGTLVAARGAGNK